MAEVIETDKEMGTLEYYMAGEGGWSSTCFPELGAVALNTSVGLVVGYFAGHIGAEVIENIRGTAEQNQTVDGHSVGMLTGIFLASYWGTGGIGLVQRFRCAYKNQDLEYDPVGETDYFKLAR